MSSEIFVIGAHKSTLTKVVRALQLSNSYIIQELLCLFKQVEYIKISIDDSPFSNLGCYFDRVADKIEEVRRRGGNSLVHCVAGVSRSASLCIAYLIKYKRMSLRKAYQHVKVIIPVWASCWKLFTTLSLTSPNSNRSLGVVCGCIKEVTVINIFR